MNSQTIFFDVGGTLVNTPDLARLMAKVSGLAEKVDESQALDFIRQQFQQKVSGSVNYMRVEEIIANTLSAIAREYRLPDISSEAKNIYFGTFLNKSSLFPETTGVLDILSNNNITMMITSDADAEYMKKELTRFNLHKYFANKFISSEVEAYKPDDKFVNRLRNFTMNNEPNCYFVGDNYADIICGKKLGIKSVLVDRKKKGNRQEADYIINNLTGLLPILKLD